eukprot:ANDGO_04778.mRNA.2 Ankyrin repeat
MSRVTKEELTRELNVRVRCQGWLTKEGRVVKSWKKRWFVLRAGRIMYFKQPNDPVESLKGCLHLKACEVFKDDSYAGSTEDGDSDGENDDQEAADSVEGAEEREYVWKFAIKCADRILKCAAKTSLERDEWVNEIFKNICVVQYIENCKGRLKPVVAAVQHGVQTLSLDGSSLTLSDMKGLSAFVADRQLCRLTSLSLLNCGLTDSFMRPLGFALRTNLSLDYLCVASNRITEYGVSELAEGMFLNCNLRSLDLSNNNIGNHGAFVVGDLVRANAQLKCMSLFVFSTIAIKQKKKDFAFSYLTFVCFLLFFFPHSLAFSFQA